MIVVHESDGGEGIARLSRRSLVAGTMARRSVATWTLVARARAIHERVITLDTHNDIDPQNFTRGCNYTMRLTTQVNLPKMKEGGLDVSFMIVYVGQSNPPQVPMRFSRPATTAPTRRRSRSSTPSIA